MSVHYQKSNAKPRPVFVGDPASICPHVDNETSIRYNRPEYKSNKAARAQQGSPADKSTPRRPGPTHRPKGTSREQWIRIMEGK